MRAYRLFFSVVMLVAVVAAATTILVEYGVIPAGPDAPPTEPLAKIANALATPPDPVGDRWPWRILWYLYPWQTLIAALLAGGGALFAGQQAYRGAMLPVRHAAKQEYRQSRRKRVALLHALVTSAEVIVGQIQIAQLAVLLAQENNITRHDITSMIIIKLPAMYPSDWEDYDNVSEAVTSASFSLAATLESAVASIQQYGGYMSENDEVNDKFVTAVLMQYQIVGAKANQLAKIAREELKGSGVISN